MATTTMMLDGDDDLSGRDKSPREIAPFATGYLLCNRWQIIERIGKGGFGFVYSALDRELDTKVAIKTLRPEHETRSETVRQFKQEIQLARQVTHKNVCRIFDVGFHVQGALRVPFFCMELLEGEPLDALLQENGPLAIEQVQVITLQVVAALEAAHAAGIVHADLKPANIMLVGSDRETRAVVTDFGLASVHSEAEGHSQVVGTPAYMAPEQVEGKRLGPAADYYALGCTLYQLISGTLPFVGDGAASTARMRLGVAPPKLSETDVASPSKWVALVRDLMDVDPATRLSDGAEVRRRLRPSRTPMLLAAALTILLVGILFVSLVAFSGDDSKKPGPFELAVPTDARARALHDEGVKLWDNFQTDAAIEVWQRAIDEGHAHPLIYDRICTALAFLNRPNERAKCTRSAFEASRTLSKDQQRFYEAVFKNFAGERVRSTQLLMQLLDRYPGSVQITRRLASVQIDNNELAEALQTLHQANFHTEKEKLEFKVVESAILFRMSRHEEAIALALKILPRISENGMARQELSLLVFLAKATENLGQLETSLDYGLRALALSRELQSQKFEAKATGLVADIARQQHRFKTAFELLDLRAARLAQEGDTRTGRQLAITRAELLVATGQPAKAEDLLSADALPHMREDGNTYWEGYALIIRSKVRRSMGKLEAALEDCNAASAVFRESNQRLLAFAQLSCGEALLDAGQTPHAARLVEKSRALRAELDLGRLLLENSMAEAEIFLAEGNFESAYRLASEVLAEHVKAEAFMQQVFAYELMARTALAMGDVERAESALASATKLGPGEHRELDLQLRLTALRLQMIHGDAEASRAAVEALRSEALDLGYGRVAKLATDALF